MDYIKLDWKTYLADLEFWKAVSEEKNIPLLIGTCQQTLFDSLKVK
jgi:hypothetical protein